MNKTEFEDYYDGVIDLMTNSVNSEKYARSLAKKNYFRIKTGFYEDENPENVAKELSFQTIGDLKESRILEEGSVTDGPVRKITRDLMFLIKKQEEGEFYLPEDVGQMEAGYSFEGKAKNVPYFSVIFQLNFDDFMKQDYQLDGSTLSDNDTIFISLKINRNKYPQLLYDLLADLNDIVRHELEHIYQQEYDLPEKMPDDKGYEEPKDIEYYKQPWEIPAQIKGFRRIVKLRNKPPYEVIYDLFQRNKWKSGLDDDDIKEITEFLTQKYKEYYG